MFGGADRDDGEATVDAIVRHGDVNTLKYAVEELSCHIGSGATQIAAQHGHMFMLRVLRECFHASWDASVAAAAASRGDVCMLQELRSRGCPWDHRAVARAVEVENDDGLAVLRFLREQGCPADHSACSAAAKLGALERLQFLREGAWASYIDEDGWSDVFI